MDFLVTSAPCGFLCSLGLQNSLIYTVGLAKKFDVLKTTPESYKLGLKC